MLLLFYASLSLAATWRESSFSLTAIGNEAGQIRTLYNRRHLLITTRIPEKASPQQQLKEIFCSNERELAIAFANMAHNAYIGGENTENWKKTADYAMEKAFGWGGEGLRGYAYVSQDQKVVVLAFKGTSAYLFPFKAGTGKQDRLNDNVMYSCCYGRDLSNLIPGFEKECRVKEDVIAYLNNTELHYYAACEKFPAAEFWFTGHSLGGTIATLLASRYSDTRAIAFASPGDRLVMQRLGLKDDASRILHFGLRSDPIFEGKCAVCKLFGYFLESKCHSGMVCRYAGDSRLNLMSHSIGYLASCLASETETPSCQVESDCSDCSAWSFIE